MALRLRLLAVRALCPSCRTSHFGSEGYFADDEAALAYDSTARTRFSVMAKCNFPLQE